MGSPSERGEQTRGRSVAGGRGRGEGDGEVLMQPWILKLTGERVSNFVRAFPASGASAPLALRANRIRKTRCTTTDETVGDHKHLTMYCFWLRCFTFMRGRCEDMGTAPPNKIPRDLGLIRLIYQGFQTIPIIPVSQLLSSFTFDSSNEHQRTRADHSLGHRDYREQGNALLCRALESNNRKRRGS